MPKESQDIRLACMSLMWGQLTSAAKLAHWLSDAAAAGYEGVATFDRYLVSLTAEADVTRRLDEAGLKLASVDYKIDRDFDRLRRVCETMQGLGARHLVMLGGLAQKGADASEIADLLNRMGEVALTYGVRAALHNHTGHTAETMEEVEALLARTDPAKVFGFLDVGHATKDFVGHPVERRAALFLERNWGRIDFLEFKDWSEAHDLNTEVGAGRCDYAAVFRIVKEKGYAGWITVEQNGPTPGKTALACATASREFIRKGLGL